MAFFISPAYKVHSRIEADAANLIHRVTFVVVIGASTGEHPELVKMNLRPDTQLKMADFAGNSDGITTTLLLRLFPGSDHDNSIVLTNEIQFPKAMEGSGRKNGK